MAKAAPSEPTIEAGQRVLDTLRSNRVPVHAAAWVLDPDRDRWTLNVVSDWYAGTLSQPHEVLARLLSDNGILAGFPSLDLADVVPVRRDSEMGEALVSLSPLARRSPRRLEDQFASGIFIPDAVLYDTAA